MVRFDNFISLLNRSYDIQIQFLRSEYYCDPDDIETNHVITDSFNIHYDPNSKSNDIPCKFHHMYIKYFYISLDEFLVISLIGII